MPEGGGRAYLEPRNRPKVSLAFADFLLGENAEKTADCSVLEHFRGNRSERERMTAEQRHKRSVAADRKPLFLMPRNRASATVDAFAAVSLAPQLQILGDAAAEVVEDFPFF